jgi:hypothetical protein
MKSKWETHVFFKGSFARIIAQGEMFVERRFCQFWYGFGRIPQY